MAKRKRKVRTGSPAGAVKNRRASPVIELETISSTHPSPVLAEAEVEQPTGWWLTRRFHALILLCVPALVLMRQTNVIFSDPLEVDPWVYLGLFKNLVEFKRNMFPETYYVTRMSWILPGWFAHALFPPVVANIALHLGVFYVVIFSLYYVISRLVNRSTALIAALACAFSLHLWTAVGSDYVAGAGIAYYMAALAALTHAALSRRRAPAAIAAGVLAAGMIYSNIFWCVLAPLLIVHFVGIAVLRNPAWKRAILPVFAWFLLGFLSLTASLCILEYAIRRTFWFYKSSIGFALAFGGVKNQWVTEPMNWHALPWLEHPIVLVALGFLALPVLAWRRGAYAIRLPLFLFFEFAAACAIFAALQHRGNPALQLYYYASYLIPPMFVALGSLLPRFPENRGGFLGTTAAIVALLSLPWTTRLGTAVPYWVGLGTIIVAGLAAAVLALALLIRNPRVSVAAGVLGLGLLAYSDPPPAPANPQRAREVYRQVMEARERIENNRQGRPIRFWYTNAEASDGIFSALNSTYLFAYTMLSDHFPDLPVSTQIEQGMAIVLPSRDIQSPQRALAILKKRGWRAVVTDTGLIGKPGSGFHVFILSPLPGPDLSQPLRASLDPDAKKGQLVLKSNVSGNTAFPAEGWVVADLPGASMWKKADGILLHTTNRLSEQAAKYAKLTAPVAGDYHFTLRYSTIFGDISFGAMTFNERDWAGGSSSSISGGISTIGFTAHLNQGQEFRLIVSNNHEMDQPSEVVLKEVLATLVTPVEHE